MCTALPIGSMMAPISVGMPSSFMTLETGMAMKSIPGSVQFEEAWEARAPLGWSVTDTEPAGKAVVALLSDWFPATTGEIVHVDGGFHAVGV